MKGLPPIQSHDVPQSSYLNIDNHVPYHVPPPPVLQQARPNVHSVVEGAMLRNDRQQQSLSQRATRESHPSDQQAAARMVTIRTPTQELTTEHGPDKPFRFGETQRHQANSRDSNPLNTSTPNAAPTSTSQRRGERQPEGRQTTYVSTQKSPGAKKRSKANYEVVFEGDYDTSHNETTDSSIMSTSAVSETQYTRPRRATSQVRTPVF